MNGIAADPSWREDGARGAFGVDGVTAYELVDPADDGVETILTEKCARGLGVLAPAGVLGALGVDLGENDTRDFS